MHDTELGKVRRTMAELQGVLKSNERARSARFFYYFFFSSIGKEQRDQLEKT